MPCSTSFLSLWVLLVLRKFPRLVSAAGDEFPKRQKFIRLPHGPENAHHFLAVGVEEQQGRRAFYLQRQGIGLLSVSASGKVHDGNRTEDVDREVQKVLTVEFLHIRAVENVVFHVQAARAALLLEYQKDRLLARGPGIVQLGFQVAGQRVEEILIRIARLGASRGPREAEKQQQQHNAANQYSHTANRSTNSFTGVVSSFAAFEHRARMAFWRRGTKRRARLTRNLASSSGIPSLRRRR